MHEEDRRSLTTHAAWCQYLATIGLLSPNHRGCKSSLYCKAHEHWVAR
jgi:hypothetical protein